MEEQLEAHVDLVMEEDVQPSFGLAINEGQQRPHVGILAQFASEAH